ncbi:response regulator [Paenibacillus puldeungensis]|uniref:Response regulator n=1 Tax=Paenibacillus puldeungensis TaxID=696536 RepID=A0ABW3RTU9_9BACL
MLKAIVVDDEILTAELICRLLSQAGVEVLGYFSNPYEVLGQIELLKPDVLFLDIDMPEVSGLELAERVHSQGHDCEIVFITAYNQYAIEAFSVNALDYLLKPVMNEDIMRAVARVEKRRKGTRGDQPKQGSRTIRVSLFGKLSMYVGDDKDPIHWMTAKCTEVLAFILLHREESEISKWKLMEAIWPEKTKEKADINLRSTISRLNKTLREHHTGVSIFSTGNGYKLCCIDRELMVDAFELEKLAMGSVEIEPGNADEFNRAISGYRGMLLEAIDSEWCEPLRACYHRFFYSAAKKLVQYFERVNSEPLKVLQIIELLIKYEPYDEEAREMALKLHYMLEGKRNAEKYYVQYREMLNKELGIEPGESIQKVFASLVKS